MQHLLASNMSRFSLEEAVLHRRIKPAVACVLISRRQLSPRYLLDLRNAQSFLGVGTDPSSRFEKCRPVQLGRGGRFAARKRRILATLAVFGTRRGERTGGVGEAAMPPAHESAMALDQMSEATTKL